PRGVSDTLRPEKSNRSPGLMFCSMAALEFGADTTEVLPDTNPAPTATRPTMAQAQVGVLPSLYSRRHTAPAITSRMMFRTMTMRGLESRKETAPKQPQSSTPFTNHPYKYM